MICPSCGWEVDDPSKVHSSLSGLCYGTQEQVNTLAMRETILWRELRDILAMALLEKLQTSSNPQGEDLYVLVTHLEEHWNPAGPPRQSEVAALRQKVRELQKEVEQRGEAIRSKNAEIEAAKKLVLEWAETHKKG